MMADDQVTSEDVMLDDDKGNTHKHNKGETNQTNTFLVERNYVVDYGIKWWLVWRETTNFKLWNQYTDHEIYEIVEPG